MICEFNRLIYPAGTGAVDPGSYMVALYIPCEKVLDVSGKILKEIKAVGYCLPTTKKQKFDIRGHWSRNKTHGIQFEVENYEEIIQHTKEGIIAYLASGQIRGIGQKTAEKIFDAFGLDTLDVLDREPEKLLAVKGVSRSKLEKICDSYMKNRGARDVVAFLTPHGITPNRAVQFYQEYGSKALEIVRNHPYQLCAIDGIGFKTADKIALSMGFSRLSPERVDEGILFTLKEAEAKGHLCMENRTFVRECLKTLDTEELTGEMVGNRAARMVYGGKLVVYNECVYRRQTAAAEASIAENAARLAAGRPEHELKDIDREIALEEKRIGVTLSEEQKGAVRMALSSSISIITGGPGTGKTMIQRAILDIYRKIYPDDETACCAPTGQAAGRMEQSTGRSAATIHKTLGLFAGEGNRSGCGETLDADLVLVDEVSMVDVHVASALFGAVKDGARLILVGDVEQLPSVGPGAVLRELIGSGCIPTSYLDKIYRQAAGSRIAANARRIRLGDASLEYGEDFQFIESGDLSESAGILQRIYRQEADAYGPDHVALLSPYRKKTETGVNALNEKLRDELNPPDHNKFEITCGNRVFREGDKVMQLRNMDDVSNGDTGYIQAVVRDGNDAEAVIDFGNGREKTYDAGDMEMLDLGYASTVHKSQGSEYQSVIISLQSAHYIMLNRPLFYTAVTRGKERVIIVGDRKAVYMAVKKKETEKRGTNLAQRLAGRMTKREKEA